MFHLDSGSSTGIIGPSSHCASCRVVRCKGNDASPLNFEGSKQRPPPALIDTVGQGRLAPMLHSPQRTISTLSPGILSRCVENLPSVNLGERAQVERVALEADLGRVGARRNEHTNDVDATHVILWPGGRKFELAPPR